MNLHDLRTLHLLEEIDNGQLPSQRYLARKLNVSLGLTNAFIKRLAQKGYCKITTIPKNRLKYILTPKGVAEKTRLSYEYFHYSFKFYKRVRRDIHALYQKLVAKDVRRIAFYGADEAAEIAYLSLQETPIELVAVVDNNTTRKGFFRFVVVEPSKLLALSFDSILITKVEGKERALIKLLELGIPRRKIFLLE